MSKHFNVAVEGDDGGLVVCQGCKSRGTYTELPTGECPTPYKSDSLMLAESMAREQALQLLLNDRDEQLHTLEQSRRAHFENAQAAERRIDEPTTPVPDDPVKWGSPKTVRQLIHQLSTLDPELEPLAMLRIPDYKDGKQIRTIPLSTSYERVKDHFLSDYKGDGRKVLAFWSKQDPRADHPALVAEKLVKRLAEEFPDSDTLLTVDCVADLITEYLIGL